MQLNAIVTYCTEWHLRVISCLLFHCYWLKQSFGQGNIFTRVSFCSQGGSAWPGTPSPWNQAGTPPGPGRYPPGPGRYPLGPGRYPQDQAGTPPDQSGTLPPGPGRYPPRTRQVPPSWTRQVNPPRPGTPPRPGRYPPEAVDSRIQSTIGRYSSYWNAFLLCLYISQCKFYPFISFQDHRPLVQHVLLCTTGSSMYEIN